MPDMDPGKILLAACVFTVGLVTWAESLSINANDLIFSDDLESPIFELPVAIIR